MEVFDLCPQCIKIVGLALAKKSSGGLEGNCDVFIDWDGTFTVFYHACCTECGYKFDFDHKENTLKETGK